MYEMLCTRHWGVAFKTTLTLLYRTSNLLVRKYKWRKPWRGKQQSGGAALPGVAVPTLYLQGCSAHCLLSCRSRSLCRLETRPGGPGSSSAPPLGPGGLLPAVGAGACTPGSEVAAGADGHVLWSLKQQHRPCEGEPHTQWKFNLSCFKNYYARGFQSLDSWSLRTLRVYDFLSFWYIYNIYLLWTVCWEQWGVWMILAFWDGVVVLDYCAHSNIG